MSHKLSPVAATPLRGETLPMLMLRLREAMMRRLRPYLRGHDLTEQQWRVLRVLGPAEELDMQAVARLACIQPPSLSRIMRKLVARGLVRRLSADADLRRVQVSLAPAGQAVIDAVGPGLWRAYRVIEAEMGTDSVAAASSLLALMLDRLPQGEPDEAEED